MKFLLVFIGGGIGSVLRYAIGKLLNDSHSGIPYGTFLVNILGSLLIGVFLGLAVKNNFLSEGHKLLLATGFCGGFTTFSSFAYENHLFLKSSDFFMFSCYTFATFIVGFFMVFLGMYFVK